MARNLGMPVAELQAALRPAVASDLESIVRLRESVFRRPPAWDDRRYLVWRYGLGTRRSHAVFRVLEIHGQVVAGLGAEEFRLATPRGVLQAACAMDILCLDEYRSFGIGGWLNQALFETYPALLALGSNENSRGLVKALFAPLPFRNEFKFPLNTRQFVSRSLRIPLLRTLAGEIATRYFFARGAWYVWRRKARHGAVREITEFGPNARFTDDGPRDDRAMCIVRSMDYLNWRYLENPRTRYKVVGYFDENRLRSFIVYTRSVSQSQIPQALYIADWWNDDAGDPVPLRSLIAELVAEARRDELQFVQAWAGGSYLARQLTHEGFVQRSAGDMASGVRFDDRYQDLATAPADCWRLTGLGDDGDLVDY